MPVCSAAPCPRLIGCLTTVTPGMRACAAVSSREPSSTTHTDQPPRATSATTSRITLPSLKAAITTQISLRSTAPLIARLAGDFDLCELHHVAVARHVLQLRRVDPDPIRRDADRVRLRCLRRRRTGLRDAVHPPSAIPDLDGEVDRKAGAEEVGLDAWIEHDGAHGDRLAEAQLDPLRVVVEVPDLRGEAERTGPKRLADPVDRVRRRPSEALARARRDDARDGTRAAKL